MRSKLTLLTITVCLAGLITACSSPKERPGGVGKASAWNQVQLRPPKRGEPVNIMAVARYLEVESLKLLEQGRVATNLLQQPRPATCSLKLALPSTRTLAGDELAGAVEMGVAVVGRLAKVSGRTQLTPTASGFFLTESGSLATCWHVVNWNKLIGMTVMTRDGRVCPVQRVLAVSTNYDLAILQVEGTGFTPLPVALNVRQGAPVWVLGHPFPWFYMLTAGIASGYYALASGGMDITLLDITADFANGSSGAPVLNESGAVVGVAATRQTLGIPGTPQMAIKGCLPSSAIIDLTRP